jgi:hypothetical protein
MARIPRMVIQGEPAVYHVVSRTALDGFVLGDAEDKSGEGENGGTGERGGEGGKGERGEASKAELLLRTISARRWEELHLDA